MTKLAHARLKIEKVTMHTATRGHGTSRRQQIHVDLKARQGPARAAPTSSTPRVGKPLKQDAASLKEAIRLAQRGDAAAFETIYKMRGRRVYSLCLRLIGDPVEAEDLTQEAFLQVFRKIHTFRGESAFGSWLHRLTANIVLMRFRKKRLAAVSLEEMIRPGDQNDGPSFEIGVPDLRLTGLFDRVNLRAALQQLPDGYKSMFLLHDVHGYEHNEIATMLGCSVGTSKSQLHKARKRLRELLHEVHRYATHPSLEGAVASSPSIVCRFKSFW
jgi:RNA polymerase sigma-70 factor (ECF subfamily)